MKFQSNDALLQVSTFYKDQSLELGEIQNKYQ